MPFDVSLTLQDDYSRRSVKKFNGTATTLAQAEIDKDALMADLMAVSLCGTVKSSLSVDEVESEAIESGANVDAGGTLHCRLNNGKLYPLKIPGIDPTLINSDGSINIAAPAITAYVSNFESGGAFTVSEGNLITAVEYGELDR